MDRQAIYEILYIVTPTLEESEIEIGPDSLRPVFLAQSALQHPSHDKRKTGFSDAEQIALRELRNGLHYFLSKKNVSRALPTKYDRRLTDSMVFLGTLDSDKIESDISEMLRSRIYLVVPNSIKETNQHYRNSVNVTSFEVFFRDHIDSTMRRWQDNGVIKEFLYFGFSR